MSGQTTQPDEPVSDTERARQDLEAWIAALGVDRGTAQWIREVLTPMTLAVPIMVMAAIGWARPARTTPVDLSPATVDELALRGISARWWIAYWSPAGPMPGAWSGSACGCRDPRCPIVHYHAEDGTCECLARMVMAVHHRALLPGARVRVRGQETGTVVAVTWGTHRPVIVRLDDGRQGEVDPDDVVHDPWPPTLHRPSR